MRVKTANQPAASGTENRNTALQGSTVPSRRGPANREANLRESNVSPAIQAPASRQSESTANAGTIRPMNSSNPGSAPVNPAAPIVPNSLGTALSVQPSQPAFKSAAEPRGVAGTAAPQVQTPARPVQRREAASSAADNSTGVQSRPATPGLTTNPLSRRTPIDNGVRNPGARPRTDLESRLAEHQSSARPTPATESPRNLEPVIRSRGLTEQSASLPYTPAPRTPYVTPRAPSYTAQPAAQTPQYRQELPKPPTTVAPERRSYSPPESSPSYQPSPRYSAPESLNSRPSRGASDYSPPSRSAPSPSGSISISPSSRQNSPPPTQIQPSQVTPSNRSSSPSGNTVPSRPSGSSNGRERQER